MTTDALPVHAALSAVMGDVQAVRKGDRNEAQGFRFRGVDAVVNAVGPALRTHGVIVLPRVLARHTETYQTSKGATMRSVAVEVEFTFVGPDGSTLVCSTVGEAADAGDKATPKAHSVAFRTALLQALCIPTDEPDPDASTHERAAPVQVIGEVDARRLADVLNAGGKEARDAWMARFGCHPATLPVGRLAEAADFVSDLEALEVES